MPYCYLYRYHYSQSMLKKYYFFKQSVHSFVGLLSNTTIGSPPPPPPPISKCGLGLIITNEYNPNVIESSSLLPQLINTKPSSPPKKKDPGGIGFVDGDGVDGLMSCTESLGFESCNERRVDDDDYCKYVGFCEEGIRDKWRIRKRNEGRRSELDKKKIKKFPPPLSSMNQNGQPRFYLKPVRKNGRLELTEVKIHRPEILHAVREDGRLRLHLVSTDVCSKINEEEEQVHNLQRQEEEEEKEEVKVEGLWNYREGSRRCHEMVDYHQQHHGINDHHHVWRQPCVSIR